MRAPLVSGRKSKQFNVKDYIRDAVEHNHWITTTVESREGYPKIMRYDLKKLVRFSAIFTMFSKGTVFTMDATALINVLLTVLISAISCALTFHYTGNDTLELRALNTGPLKELSAQIGNLVPFCLALYLSLVLSRWWTLRVSGLGKVFDALSNLCMIIACELHEDKWEAVRQQVAKFGLASIELIVQAARGRADLDFLVEEDLLNEREAESLLGQEELWERPMICWAWILRICLSALDYGHTPSPRTAAVMAQCVGAREGMATMNTYLDTQLPFGYVHLITLLVNLQNFTMAVKTGIIVAQAWSGRTWFVVAQQVLTLVVVVFLYQGILQISFVIADPFGDDILDFPIRGFTNYIATTVDAMFEAQADCPVVAQDGTLFRPRPREDVVASVDGACETDASWAHLRQQRDRPRQESSASSREVQSNRCCGIG